MSYDGIYKLISIDVPLMSIIVLLVISNLLTTLHLSYIGRGLMHHSMTLLPSGAILIIGGRGSPKQPNSILYLLSFNDMSNGWSWKIVQTKGMYIYSFVSSHNRHHTHYYNSLCVIRRCTRG